MSTLKVNSISDSAGANGNAITLATDGTCTAKITNPPPGNRNKIINGAMRVAQRATSKTGAGGGDGYWIADRWRLFSSGAARFTVTRPNTSSGTQPGFPNSYKFECTTADTSVAAGEYLGFQQILEGQDVQDFLKGTSSAKEFTLSFYVKTNKSGVYTVELNDHDNTRQISKTFTVSDGNWNRYTVTFPADTTGFFDNDNDNSLQVNFWLIAGTNYTSGTLNSSAWAAKTNANRVSSSNVNIGDSTSNTLEITGVQLEVGGTATDFEHRSYADELRRCYRYCQMDHSSRSGDNYHWFAQGFSGGLNYAFFVIDIPEPMRVTPSLVEAGIDAGSSSSDGNGMKIDHRTTSGLSVYAISSAEIYASSTPERVLVYVSHTSSGTQGCNAGLVSYNNQTSYLLLEAELT